MYARGLAWEFVKAHWQEMARQYPESAYRRMYDPEAKLYLVGGSASRTYWSALEGYAVALGLLDAVRLTGPVPAGTLAAKSTS